MRGSKPVGGSIPVAHSFYLSAETREQRASAFFYPAFLRTVKELCKIIKDVIEGYVYTEFDNNYKP